MALWSSTFILVYSPAGLLSLSAKYIFFKSMKAYWDLELGDRAEGLWAQAPAQAQIFSSTVQAVDLSWLRLSTVGFLLQCRHMKNQASASLESIPPKLPVIPVHHLSSKLYPWPQLCCDKNLNRILHSVGLHRCNGAESEDTRGQSQFCWCVNNNPAPASKAGQLLQCQKSSKTLLSFP